MLTVGIVGAGGMGKVHARQYAQMSEIRLIVHDRTPQRLEELSAIAEFERADTVEHLIELADVVDICLPTDLHEDAALRSIAAGRATFVEKPMASDEAACERILNAAERGRIPLSVGHVLRFFPEFEAAHQAVESGSIGVPAVARTRRGGRTPLGSEGWFRKFERSGGVLLDLAIHDFDWLRWTLGPVAEVQARSGAQARPVLVGDYALAVLRFRSGVLAHVEATWLDPSGFRVTFEVCGTEGMIEFDSSRNAAVRRLDSEGTVAETPTEPGSDPYYRQLAAFLESVKRGAAPAVTGADGLEAVRISRAALESSRSGKSVKLDAV